MRINNFDRYKLFSGISETFRANQKADLPVNDKETDRINRWNNNNESHIGSCPKWDSDKIPLKFFVNKNIADEKFLPEFINAAKSAFQPWSRASYGLIRFQETFNRNDADITIDWSDTVVFGRDFEVGQNNLKVVNNRIQKAEITIIIYPIIDRLANSSSRIERVRRTDLHEIGHSLGLNHSNSSKDVMFHRGITNKTLSPNDIIRLNELYSSKKSDILI